MTLDEAIAHAREVAKMKMAEYENHYDKDGHYYPRQCKRYAEQQEQLADWLEELKLLREEKSEFQLIARDNYEIGYNKAIDDFEEKVKEMYAFTILEEVQLEKIAEQLKAGGENENYNKEES